MSTTRLHFIRHGEAYSNMTGEGMTGEGKVVSGMHGDVLAVCVLY